MVTRPVLRWHGGKWNLAPWVIQHLPAHRIYVEPFGGAASVLLRKPRAYAEVYNDLDDDVVGMFRVLRDPLIAEQLVAAIRLTPFARIEQVEAYEQSADPVERARRLIVRSYMDETKNSDVWRIDRIWEASFSGGVFTLGEQLCDNGELEVAIKETTKANFMGGNTHGNQEKFAELLLVDGISRSLTDYGVYTCRTLELYQGSDLFRVGTSTDWTPKGANVAKLYTRWRFNPQGGLRLSHRLEWLASLTLQFTNLTMLPVERLNPNGVVVTNAGARSPTWAVEDLSTSGYAQVYSAADAARIWGPSGHSFGVEIVKGWDLPNRRFRFRPDNDNKLYFDATGDAYVTAIGQVMDFESVITANTQN